MQPAQTISRFLMMLVLLWLLPTWSAFACVGPPPEPFCTKTLALAIAGPPTVLIPAGGTFDIEALLYFGLSDFPEGTGSCPVGPYGADISIVATCTPGGNGSGQLFGASVTTGYNELTVPITMPAGPPRACALTATATMTLLDGMVLTETADSVACLAEAAPGNPSLPRLSIELIEADGELARVHPGDPASRTFRITNNDPSETFTGVLAVDMINESRMPGSSGPMPEGTAVVSVSDPVEGDNFPIEVLLGDVPQRFGDPVTDACVTLPPDPTDPEFPLENIEIVMGPNFATTVTVHSRPWGLCADGSCGRSTLTLDGSFSDLSPGLACTGFVTAVDSSVAPERNCDDSGEVVMLPPPPNPLQPVLPLTGRPRPGFLVELLALLTRLDLTVNGAPAIIVPSIFTEHVDARRGRIQSQFVSDFAVDSFFDVSFEIDVTPDPGGLPVGVELTVLPLVSAPTGFETIAPFVEARHLVTEQGSGLVSFFDLGLQVNVIAVDDQFDRRRVSFDGITFARKPDGSGLIGSLSGGTVEPGAGSELRVLEFAVDFWGFSSPEPQGSEIFTDGFESGNTIRWSISTVP